MYKYLFNSKISMYSVCLAVGILCALLYFRIMCGKKKVSDDSYNFYSTVGIVAIALGLFFAMLFQSVYNWIDDIIANGFANATFRMAGLTFMGGLIGGVGTFVLVTIFWQRKVYFPAKKPMEGASSAEFAAYEKKRAKQLLNVEKQKAVRYDFWQIAEIAAGSILIAHAIGRIGCFLAGCCYGIQTDGPLGVHFPGHSHNVYPTNLFESIFLFVVFGIAMAFTLTDKPKGYNLIIYALSYAVFRFLIEYIRGDERGSFIPGLTPSQFQSIILFIAGLVLLWYKIYRDKHFKPRPIVPTELDTSTENLDIIEDDEISEDTKTETTTHTDTEKE